MAKNVSFYGQAQSPLMGPIQRDYASDPRRRMAEQLMQQGAQDRPIQSHLQGLAKLAQVGVGSYLGGQARDEMQGREQGLNADMLKVLAGGQQQPIPMEQGVQGPPAMSPGGYEGMTQALGGIDNPDLAQFGQQLAMGQMQQQEANKQSEIQRQAKLADAMALKASPGSEKGTSPYSTPIQTSQGWLSYDNRTGQYSPITSAAGDTALPIAADPELGSEMAGAKASGGAMGKKNTEQFFAVKHAFNQREDIAKLVTHLKSSDAITGFGAEMLKDLERVKAQFGADAKTASDTEILDVMMGKEVFPMIKALGVGARGMDTPAEREFMRSVLTGSISLNKATLIKMAEIRSDVAERTINNWNKRMDSGELDRFYEAEGVPKTRFELNGQPTANPEDQAALEWATANPQDPRAAAIRQKLGQ